MVRPQGEVLIRVVWPAVTRHPLVATLARLLMRPIITAPLAGLLLAPFYFGKVMPGIATRYTLTNQRLLIERGLFPHVVKELALANIDEVLIRSDANSAFYRAADLEIIGGGKILLTLAGVPNPEAFRQGVLNACMAWVPGKAHVWGPSAPAAAGS